MIDLWVSDIDFRLVSTVSLQIPSNVICSRTIDPFHVLVFFRLIPVPIHVEADKTAVLPQPEVTRST